MLEIIYWFINIAQKESFVSLVVDLILSAFIGKGEPS